MTLLAVKVTTSLAAVRGAMVATQIEALKTRAALDAMAGAGMPVVGPLAAGGLLGAASGGAAAAAATAASRASPGAMAGAGSAFAPPAGTASQATITRQMGALREWDIANPTFWAGVPGFIPPASSGASSGVLTPTSSPEASAMANAIAAAREARAASREAPSAAAEAWARIAANRTPIVRVPPAQTRVVPVAPAAAGGGGGGPAGGGGPWGGFWGKGGGGGHGHIGFSPFGGFFFRRGGGGGGGEDSGWGRKLLWGGGGMLGLGAGAGSLMSFAGLGAEHLLLTGAGVVGSGIGALGGAGLIGLGGLGQMAVGSGSDMAVMKSTIADTKELGKAYEKLTTAIERYGKHSKQAREATEELHQSMRSLGNTPGVKAELRLAKSAMQLNKLWDLKTSGARIQAVNISEQGLGFATQMVPHIAHWAQMNLSIINKDLKPLFKWLEGPQGMGIFANLERKFKEGLPTAMHAFDMGVQVVLKTINAVQKYTGKLVKEVDKLLTYANSPEGFKKWEGIIASLVADFHAWWDLIKVVGRDLYDLFSRDAHTGRSIVETITQMLEKLGEWERSVAGSKAIHNLFVIHREEVLELLKVLPPLLSTFGKIYMVVAPPLVLALTQVAKAFNSVLEVLVKVPGGAWVLGLGLIAARLKLLIPLLGLFQKTAVGGALIGGFKGTAPLAGAAAAREVGPAGIVGGTTAAEAGAGGLLAGAARGAGVLLRGGAYTLGGYFAGEAAKGAIGGKPGTTRGGLGELAKEVGLFGGAGATLGLVGGPFAEITTPVGALIGGTIGAGKFGLESLLGGRGGGGKPGTPQSKFAQEATLVARSMHGYIASLHGVEGAEANLVAKDRRHQAATEAVAKAHRELNLAVARFGPASKQAYEAELRLANAQHHDALTAHEAQEAHRLKGYQLQKYKLETEALVTATEQHLPKLEKHFRILQGEHRAEPANLVLLKHLIKAQAELAHANETVSHSLEGAGTIAGKPFQKRIHEIIRNAHYEAKVMREAQQAALEQGGGLSKTGRKSIAEYIEGVESPESRKGVAGASETIIHALMHGNSPGGLESTETLQRTHGAGKSVAQQYAVGLQSQVTRVAVAGMAIVDALFSSLSAPSGAGSSGRAAGPHARGKGGMSAGFVAGRELGMELAKGAASDARHLRRAGASGAAGARFAGAFSRGRFTFPLPRGSWTAGSVDQGWDISAPGGTPLLAVGAGTIMGHGISGFGPWAPILKLDSGGEVYYGHAGPGHELRTGTHVRAGQVIGEVGKGIVGMSSGPHLEVGFYPPGPMGAGSRMKHALGYAAGGRIPGMRQARDNVPIMASPGEFMVTGSGEHMLERMTGVPRVLDRLEHVQRPHFAGGGRVEGTLAGPASVHPGSRGLNVNISFSGPVNIADAEQLKAFGNALAQQIEHSLRNLPDNAAEPTFAT